MNWVPAFLRKARLEQELDKELRFHFEQQLADNIASGMSPEAAQRKAALEFGGLEQIKEYCRDERPGQSLESVWQDVRFACRQIRKAPGFALTVVLTLALGIGGCTAIFSLINGILLRKPPYPDADRIVIVRETQLPKKPKSFVSAPTFLDWKTEAKSFAHLAAMWGTVKTFGGEAEPMQVTLGVATADYFAVFGLQPTLGRTFTPEEDKPGSRVIVLGHAFWQRTFGGATDILGRAIKLDQDAYTVIGVAPLALNDQRDGWIPMGFGPTPKYTRGQHYFSVYGRLKHGVAVATADAEIKLIAARLAKAYPETNEGWNALVMTLHDAWVGGLHIPLYTLLAAVACVLLIGCANIASLLLARATARSREMSIRTALGAGRGRLVRQLLTESILLAGLGGGAGVALAYAGFGTLLRLAPMWITQEFPIAIDGRVLVATLVLTIVTGIAFGLAPAWLAARTGVNGALKQTALTASQGKAQRRISSSLVILEVALALVLLSAAGLLARSFSRLMLLDRGFNPDQATLLQVALPPKKYGTDQQRMAFVERLHAQLETVQGIEAFGITTAFPLSVGSELSFTIPGKLEDPRNAEKLGFTSTTAGYFKAMGFRLVRGRLYGARDDVQAESVAVINESLAHQYFGDEDPIGREIVLRGPKPEIRRIIGIVADMKNQAGDGRLQCFGPLAQAHTGDRFFFTIVRSPLPLNSLAAALKPAVYAVDKDQPVQRIAALSSLLDEQWGFSEKRLVMTLVALFSVIAALIAAVGIYAVMAWSVTQRTTEMGVRVALGATPADILRLVMKDGAKELAWGLALGLAGALAGARLIEAQLFHTSAYEPLTLCTVVLLLMATAAVACFVPARRATKVDPMVALRCE